MSNGTPNVGVCQHEREIGGRLAESQAPAAERHYSPAEIARMWNLSPDVVRRTFAKEPGVLVKTELKKGKRPYTTLRIPQSVLDRVHRRMRNP